MSTDSTTGTRLYHRVTLPDCQPCHSPANSRCNTCNRAAMALVLYTKNPD